jgi:hypothetical protein
MPRTPPCPTCRKLGRRTGRIVTGGSETYVCITPHCETQQYWPPAVLMQPEALREEDGLRVQRALTDPTTEASEP